MKESDKIAVQKNYRDRLESIRNWAEEHSNFDTTFIDSLIEQVDEKCRPLSEPQRESIDNILDRFSIDLGDY
jgi:hypothetical protein